MSVEKLVVNLQECVISDPQLPDSLRRTIELFSDTLSQSSRSTVKRCKERLLDEAGQMLKRVSGEKLCALQKDHLQLLVRLLISLQLQMVSISTACRKLDLMLQQLAKANHELVFNETSQELHSVFSGDQVPTLADLQAACMFLEDSAVGRQVWQKSLASKLTKISDLFPLVMQDETLRDGPLCYLAVKVCLQIFQLLSSEVAPLVWEEDHSSPAVQKILQALMSIILGQSCSRDTRLLAGTAVAMLINTDKQHGAGGAAAWSLVQISYNRGPWQLTVGALQVECNPIGPDGVGMLAVSRGLLTCCHPQILLASHGSHLEVSFLTEGLFPMVRNLCEKTQECHYFAFEVLTLWLKKVRECVADLWEKTGVRLLPDDSGMLKGLTHIIWTHAESPVEGVPDFANKAFSLLLDLYDMDTRKFYDAKKSFFSSILLEITKLPWETKAKYQRLCALLPYLGAERVLDECPDIPGRILDCLSTNHLSPCGTELYRCLIQQQRRDHCDASPSSGLVSEADVTRRWAQRWQPVLLRALASDATLLQNNSSTHLLPCTLQLLPAAAEHLLASLDARSPGHLYAWACVLSSYRAVTGHSPWAPQGPATYETLQLALRSADDKIRLAAFNLLCCSPKSREAPTREEMDIMREYIPLNLNSESSPFRQHFQAGVRRFVVRIRDSCLALARKSEDKKERTSRSPEMMSQEVDQGVEFVEWMGQLPYSNLAPGFSYQRKKTALLLLTVVLETCTDTWSPDRKKGQPPADMKILLKYAHQKGYWDFFSRTKQLVLLCCLEDSTVEIRELSTDLLLRFFPSALPADVTAALWNRARQLLCSPRVQEAQMGALMLKVLQQKFINPKEEITNGDESVVKFLLKELRGHYEAAKADMMLAARTKPIHGVLVALQRCLFEARQTAGATLTSELLELLESTSLLLLGVLRGDADASLAEKDTPPSFCDMGNAISSLISHQHAPGPADTHTDREECVLLSEEHSLLLTCCWVSLKEIGNVLGALVETTFSHSDQPEQWLLPKADLTRALKIFKSILLGCRHWGAIEGCCVGFTKFCSCLLSCNDPELSDIPVQMLKQGLQIAQCPRSASVTRRAAGLPMLILCVVTAEEASGARPLLTLSMRALMDTAKTPIRGDWDQTLDLPQVCAVHTLQALVRGAGLAAAIRKFVPDVIVLSLTLLSSPCWVMRNAALQLYSSLCSRVLGQKSGNDETTQHAMTSSAFLFHYRPLQSFLLGQLVLATESLRSSGSEARLHLQPSLFPILTLLAQLQPAVQDTSGVFLDFAPPLLRLAASPIYSVRVMASKALVAVTPTSEHVYVLDQLMEKLPGPGERRGHNQLHGQLLQIRAILQRSLRTNSASSEELSGVVSRVQTAVWLGTGEQRCLLVRAAYVAVADSLRGQLDEDFLSRLGGVLIRDLSAPQQGLQVGLSAFHRQAIHFLCGDPEWGCKVWGSFCEASTGLKRALVAWVQDEKGLKPTHLREVICKVLQSNLKEALLSHSVEYRTSYLSALEEVMKESPPRPPREQPPLLECVELLLADLEQQRGGPELLSHTLTAATLLLFHSPDSSERTGLVQRWCSILERLRDPVTPEVLRISCSESLGAATVALASSGPRQIDSSVTMRLINTALHLLQDQCQQVRAGAARFAVSLPRAPTGGSGQHRHPVQANHALSLLLDQLLEEFWDTPDALHVLLAHLPPFDLSCVLTRVCAPAGCSGLYEQDAANVFAEPSAMSALVLPYLLRLLQKSSQSAALARRLSSWAEGNVAQVLDNLTACERILPEETLTSSWLLLLADAHFHATLCGLFTRAALLLRLPGACAHTQPLQDPNVLCSRLKKLWESLCDNGVLFPSSVSAALTALF